MADEMMSGLKRKNEKTERDGKRRRTGVKKKPGYDETIFKETEYVIKEGLRYVKPYSFTFTTYCKGRWLKRQLIDVLSQEFQAETAEYYRKAIIKGSITVNGRNVMEDVILKDNDIISHKVHRHEPPVTAEPIQIITETEDLVVVNKPSSIPIHPCGRYRHNTLVFILGREFGLINLYTIHRIDRLTSGIVIFAKSLKKAQELEKQLREHELRKEYVCKVRGEFPSGDVDCCEPIAVVSHKVGVCRVHCDGKPCRTVFTRESFDGTNSIVKCQPFTGRMHQIRVHLQWLGHPIVDDPIYNHEAWGLGGGKGGVEEEKAWKVIESIATCLRNNDTEFQLPSNSLQKSSSDVQGTNSEPAVCHSERKPRVLEDLRHNTGSLFRPQGIELQSAASMRPNENPVRLETTVCDVTPKSSEMIEDSSSLGNEILVPDDATQSNAECVLDRVDETERKDISDTCRGTKESDESLQTFSSGETDVKLEENSADAVTLEDWSEERIPDCTECQKQRRDPTAQELTMCLHAAVYKGPDWEFRCPWPVWALPKESS